MIEPVEIGPATWEGFEQVMGERGGCGGCWCMLWRLTKRQMDAGMGAANRAAMKVIFEAGDPPGLIAWQGDRAIGWVQVAARRDFPRLKSARVLQPVDDLPVWSVACFLVERSARRQGISVALLRAACEFARARGATHLEGYPVDPVKPTYPPVYAWTGFLGTFRAVGFTGVARRSPTWPIMRKAL